MSEPLTEEECAELRATCAGSRTRCARDLERALDTIDALRAEVADRRGKMNAMDTRLTLAEEKRLRRKLSWLEDLFDDATALCDRYRVPKESVEGEPFPVIDRLGCLLDAQRAGARVEGRNEGKAIIDALRAEVERERSIQRTTAKVATERHKDWGQAIRERDEARSKVEQLERENDALLEINNNAGPVAVQTLQRERDEAKKRIAQLEQWCISERIGLPGAEE